MKHTQTFESFVNESSDDTLNEQTAAFKSLIVKLKSARDTAINVGRDVNGGNHENYFGVEGNEVGTLLMGIWNAFATGDPKDDTYEDEWFKQ